MSQSTSPTAIPPQSSTPIGVPASASGGGTFFNGGGTAPPSNTGSTGSPLISQDQSAFSQYVLGQTGGYNVTIGNLPGVTGANQPTTIGSALQDFMDLPPAQLQQLEMQLWDAGYYINSDGSPVSAQDIRFGVPGDPASWTAFARALGAAASSGTSLTNLLQTRAGQGAGMNAALPSPVTGGGNTYTIDLSNPTQIKYVADQIFQSALGRNATASEVTDITGKLRSQETSQGLTQEQGKEQQARSAYGAQVNQRNISYENQTNPNLGGRVPAGPFNNAEQWAAGLLSYMNMPVTTSNVAALSAWAQKTGKFSDGSFNPLGTSRPEGGSTTGSGGTQQFQNWAQGLQATASMLLDGKYQGLVSALQNGNASDAVKNDAKVQQELHTWSGGSFSSLSADSQTTQQAAEASFYWNQSQNPSPAQGQPNPDNMRPNEQASYYTSQYDQQQTAQSPAVQNYLHAVSQAQQGSTVAPQNVSSGQQPPNPGDTYLNPVTVYDVNPASEASQAYREATTGPNRIAYAGNNFLGAYQAVLSMIKAAGPTAS